MLAAVVAVVPHVAGAHATPPTTPCGYECLWPIGAYEIPGSMRVGEPVAISYTYAWEEAPGNGSVGTLAQRELPPGRHAWPEEWGEPARPSGYAGSAVTLVLPEGVGVVGWERRGLERSEAWTDWYGRTTYRYSGLNAYAGGVSAASVELVVEAGATIYPDDKVWIDLGVRGAEWRSPVAYLNRAGDVVSVSAEPAGAAGSAGGSFPDRNLHMLPGSAVAPLDEGSLGAEARRTVTELLLGLTDSGVRLDESDVPGFARAQVMARAGGEAAGGAGESGVVYAYGIVKAHKRSPAFEVADIAASPAEGVRVCAYEEMGGARTLLTHNGMPACSTVDASGFFVVPVPVDGADIDGVLTSFVISLENELVRVVYGQSGADTVVSAVPAGFVVNASPAAVPVGEITVSTGVYNRFSEGYVAYDEVLTAHEYFSEAVGYDVPPVTIRIADRGQGAFYAPATRIIVLEENDPFGMISFGNNVVWHEYGHYIMDRVYERGIPSTQSCIPHTPDRASSPACAWSEGWASFVAALVRDSPVYAAGAQAEFDWEAHETRTYTERVSALDPRTGSTLVRDYHLGEDGEGSVAAILWDIYDGLGEPGDDVSGSVQDIWAAFASAREEDEVRPAVDIHGFYDDWSDAGGQNLDSVFAINGVDVTPRFAPSSLALSVERGGAARSGDYAAYAKEDDAVVARLDLGRPASAGTVPTASVFGGVPSPMSAAGDGGREWTSRATVPGGAPGGAASVTIRATGPGLAAAGSGAVVHGDGSETVTIRLASVPLNGEYTVTARASVADSGGTALGSDQSLAAGWNAARPEVVTATISPDGREVTLVLSEEIGGLTGRPCVVSRLGDLPAVDWLNVPGSDAIKLHLASAPADTSLFRVCGATITDAQGHSLRNSFDRLLWNPEAPAFEHVTVAPDGRTLTLTFSEKVYVWRGPVQAGGFGFLPVTNGETTLSATHTIRLPQALEPNSYIIRAPDLYTDGTLQISRRPAFLETREFTYNPSGPTFDHVKVSPDGMTLTLTFSEGMDGDYVTRNRFTLGGGLSLAGENPIAHTDGSRTVSLRLASAPASDGTYEVIAKETIRSSAGAELGSDQERTFTWNPEAPTFEHVEVSADGRTVTLTFSEGLHSNTVSPGRTIQASAGLEFEGTRHARGSDKVTLSLARAPEAGTHTVYVSREVADVAGRQMAVDQERSFAWDASPPAFESVEASADGRTVTLTFSEGLDTRTVTTCDVARVGTTCPLYGPGAPGSTARTVTTGNFVLPTGLEFLTVDGEDAVRPILHADGGAQVIIRLASPPPAAGDYTVTAKSGIRDTTNVAMGSDQARSFSWAPGIPKLESASFSSDGRAVTLGFSEGLDASTVTGDSVSIDGGSAALLVTQRAAGAGDITVDTEAPRLLDALFTSAGEARLEFSEPLDDTTVVPAAFGVGAAGGGPIAATPSYAAGERVVTLALSPDAAAGTEHEISVRAGLADRAGNPVAATTRTATPPAAPSSGPTFTARAASDRVTVVTFSEDVRLIEGQELDWRDWLVGGVRPRAHFVDLENRKVFLGFVSTFVRFSPYSGDSPKIEGVTGHDLPVDATATVPAGIFPSFFADAVAEGRLEVSFDLELNPLAPLGATGAVSGTTVASEWRVNGAAATGLSASATGAPMSSITVNNAKSFYLHHGVAGVDGALQVEYVGSPEGSANALVSPDGNALEPTKATSVDRIPNTVVNAEFLDSRTIKYTATKALDPFFGDRFQVAGPINRPSASSIDGSDPKSAIVRLGVDARDGCNYFARSSLLSPAIRFGLVGEIQPDSFKYVDTHAPVIRSATTGGTSTDVTFNEPVSFGDSPTLAQHRGHWSVEADGEAMEISSVAVSGDDASTVTIVHAPLPRKDAAPTVKYDGSADDDARVRDTRASRCTDVDATPKNAQDGMLDVVASDGVAPDAASVSATVLGDGGSPKSGPNALWAGIGDTVAVSLAMDEDGREATPPRLIAAGSRVEMAKGATARLWSGGVSIGAGAAQGALGYTITAPDAAGNLGVFADADGDEPIARVDTVLPGIASTETVRAGETLVTLTEGVWGAATASDWYVGGMRATGISAGGGGFAPAVALSGATSLVLAHPELGGTGGTPSVVYGEAGAPGAAPDPAPAPDPLPGPPRAGIALDVGALDGAAVRLGESRAFDVSVTVADGGAAVVLLSGEPDFVTVENTGINRARITVNAAHASAAAGEHMFTVNAATGPDPATRQVTVTVL